MSSSGSTSKAVAILGLTLALALGATGCAKKTTGPTSRAPASGKPHASTLAYVSLEQLAAQHPLRRYVARLDEAERRLNALRVRRRGGAGGAAPGGGTTMAYTLPPLSAVGAAAPPALEATRRALRKSAEVQIARFERDLAARRQQVLARRREELFEARAAGRREARRRREAGLENALRLAALEAQIATLDQRIVVLARAGADDVAAREREALAAERRLREIERATLTRQEIDAETLAAARNARTGRLERNIALLNAQAKVDALTLDLALLPAPADAAALAGEIERVRSEPNVGFVSDYARLSVQRERWLAALGALRNRPGDDTVLAAARRLEDALKALEARDRAEIERELSRLGGGTRLARLARDQRDALQKGLRALPPAAGSEAVAAPSVSLALLPGGGAPAPIGLSVDAAILRVRGQREALRAFIREDVAAAVRDVAVGNGIRLRFDQPRSPDVPDRTNDFAGWLDWAGE